ncbi:MAG: 4a-hydroxytetrahydrobiopterin dehydratase [Acidimicrobiia bacterium]|nr:4a-hydroxytetrahydrobiopterin dehydratase [Acidimicrobiia bacterium]MDH3471575.1 4a-hydroxytetrahydrobiopterin dehydratase [Acidimicrobiia bacterium]
MLLSPEDRESFVADHPEWVLGGEEISRTFVFSDFAEAIGFVNRAALVAEKADHHPDIDIRWNKVTMTLTTHDQGGLTKKDVELAKAFDGFV